MSILVNFDPDPEPDPQHCFDIGNGFEQILLNVDP
jgi:hypothetical protein